MNHNRIRSVQQLLRRSGSDRRGSVMLEFALLLPVLSLLMLSSLEVVRSLRYIQTASLFSREAASAAYRECQNLDAFRTRLCLQDIGTRMQQFLQTAAPNGRVVISVFEDADPDSSGSYRRLGTFPVPAANPQYPSRIRIHSTGLIDGQPGSQTAGAISGPLAAEVLDAQRVVVTAEAYVPFEPWFNTLQVLFNLRDGAFYDATII